MKKIISIFFTLLFISIFYACSQSFTPAKPTPKQLELLDMEFAIFVHYSIDAYAERGARPGQTPASAFNPTELDVEQWVRTAKEMGAKFIVLTARHEQGFCLWPTNTTDYSIKNSPYKDGKGDIVREFIDACRKYNMKPGLYTAPWIDSNWESHQPGYKDGDSGDINKFDNQDLFDKVMEKEKAQFRELLTNYGPLVFIWDDHFGRSDALYDEPKAGRLRQLYAELNKLAHELQPNCLLLGRDVEHVGNEDGKASYPLWNSLNTIDGTLYTVSDTYKWDHDNTGNPYGKFFRPQISTSTVAFTSGGWMWNRPRTPHPMERIMKTYYETIGRGSTLIINFAPDRRGLVEKETVAAAQAFGAELKRRFDHPVACSDKKDSKQLLKFKSPTTFNHVVLMENMKDGQRIAAYTVEAEINGQWKTIVNGQTIGHKRIDSFPTVTATALRFKVTNAIAKPALMRRIAIYNVRV